MFDLGGIKVDGEGRGEEERGGIGIDKNVFPLHYPSPLFLLSKVEQDKKDEKRTNCFIFPSLLPLSSSLKWTE